MTTTVQLTIRLAGLLIAAASLPTLSQLHLAPVYGAPPASANHHTLTNITVLASLLAGPSFVSSKVLGLVLPIAVLRLPLQHVFNHSIRNTGAILSPLLFEAILFMPLLFLAVNQAYAELIELFQRLVGPRSSPVKVLVPPLLFAMLFMLQAWASITIPAICATVNALLSRRMLQLVLCDLPLVLSIPRRLTWRVEVLLALLAMTLTQIYNPKQPGTSWSVLAHGESVTGYISVLENAELQYRLLRCDHSLLGGEWLLTEQRVKNEGWQVPEPVFGVFAMLEAVRLVRGPGSQGGVQKNDAETSALVIGLGAGTAPKALISHGIPTTILELDPLVHAYATTYFALPPNHTFVPGDAVSWVHNATSVPASSSNIFTYIIHDVFTGGEAPLALYTTTFLRALRSLLKVNGVAAINFTGDLARPESPMHAVLRTIMHVFEGRCRAFRDTPQSVSEQEPKDEDMLNVVIFCVASADSWPFQVRDAVEGDYLKSQTRRQFLVPRKEMEVMLPTYEGESNEEREVSGMPEFVTEANLGSWKAEQLRAARAHWRGMREVVPARVWEGW